METCFRLSLLLAFLIISVYAKNPKQDHIFVFEGEHLTIDCAGGDQANILKYREKAESDPIIYYFGTTARAGAPKEITARQEGNDYFYDINKANLTNGGEYECDWTPENDETNHYVNIVDNSTLKCPEFPDHVMAGEAIEGLNCSISKFGTVIHSWLNNADKAEALNLDFTVVDAEGNPVKVEYAETQDSIIAKVVDLKLSKEQNGTTLSCKFVSMHKTDVSCQSNAAQVHWKASGLKIDAPENAEIGKAFEAKCDLTDAGNPQNPIVFKVNDVESSSFNVTPTKDQGPAVNVSCIVGDLVDAKSIPLHAGPESIEPSVEKIEAKAGEKLDFACTMPVEPYPAAVISYKVGGEDIEPNATATADFNDKEITCTAVNTVSGHKVSGKIPLDIKFAPMAKKSEETVEDELDSSVALDCSLPANPTPTYAWSFSPKDSANSSPKPSAVKTTSAKHEIAKLAPEDLGTYICTATNELGTAQKTFTLNEKESNAADAILVPNLIILVLAFLSSTLNFQ